MSRLKMTIHCDEYTDEKERAMNASTVLTGSAIPIFQLLVVRSALKLEARGMKHSKGAIRPKWAKHLGLKPRDERDKFIARLTELIDTARAERETES